jgi:hypothetical protein
VNGTLKLSARNETADDLFYINGGELSVLQQEGITYAESKALPYIELGGGVTPDGGYSSKVYPVKRDGANFLLTTPDNSRPDNIVGWTYDKTENGLSWFKRNSNYVYIYNPNELK